MDVELNYKDNSVHNGDNIFAPLSSLEKAIDIIIKKFGDDEELVDFIEDLSDLVNSHPNREIVGLEEKLNAGGRGDLVADATYLKNKFERRVAKNQLLAIEQHVYVQILSAIISIWKQKIRPLINSNSGDMKVDEVIFEEILCPIHKAVIKYDSLITTESVSGMLYFLTGKCHVRWDGIC
ncbi:ABC-three component system protein [Alloalcanivorax mobilis]|uniref:ABC-three component system protein n=1 Tax=Alloalcanivorax mobilis TaxID=2019569 RepID=UPI000C769093|nr:ABC-three component system protein [Alloalcanivorax mobilis]